MRPSSFYLSLGTFCSSTMPTHRIQRQHADKTTFRSLLMQHNLPRNNLPHSLRKRDKNAMNLVISLDRVLLGLWV